MLLTARCRCGPPVHARSFARDAAPPRQINDPTGTMPLQQKFRKELDARWAQLRKMVPSIVVARTDLANTIAHSAATGQDTVKAFQAWFDKALKTLVVSDGRWMARYVREAGDAAILRAATTPGVDRVPPLQTLAYTELQGIAEAASQQAVRAYANGLLTRQTPAAIARAIQAVIDKVGIVRSNMLVSFIVVRTFSAVTLDAFRSAGVSSVGIKAERAVRLPTITRDAPSAKKSASSKKGKGKSPSSSTSGDLGGDDLVEVLTAGDNDVCEECQDISDDGPYTLDEAEDLIPAHPNCRCAFVPWGDDRYASVHEEDLGDAAPSIVDSQTHIAAGVMFLDQTGKALFLKRSDTGDHAGEWCLPGGAVEPGELEMQTAAREAGEETGVYPELPMEQIDRRELDGVEFTTYGVMLPAPFLPTLNAEHTDYVWRRLDDPPQPLHPGVKATIDHAVLGDEFDPNQPRDDHGQWSSGGANGGPELKSWTPPQSDAEWAKVGGQDHTIGEPPLPNLKMYSYINSKNEKVEATQRLSSGVIMREKDGRTWIVKPTNGFGGYNYTFPKGGVEEGLHPQANAIKETYEETGLKARITGYAGDYKGDTGITRMYHAVREDGHPKDKGWETEKVRLAHPTELPLLLNRSRDRKIASHHIIGDEFDPNEPRDEHGQWSSGGGALGFSNTLKEGGVKHKVEQDYMGQTNAKAVTINAENHLPSLKAIAESNPDYSHTVEGPAHTTYVFGSTDDNEHNLPHPSAEYPIDMQDLTKVSGKMGSNEGGVYKGALGDKFYVKQPPTPDHVTNELVAAKLYQLAGAKTLNYIPVKGGAHVATEMEDLAKKNVSQLDPAERDAAKSDFAVHAWIANWDAAGTGGDNIGVRKNGEVVTLDTGGSLKYRAQGDPKGLAFGDKVTETNTLRDPSKNYDAAKLYGDMTNEQMIASMKRVTALSHADIWKTVIDNGGGMDLAAKMVARQDDLKNQIQNMTGAKELAQQAQASKAGAGLLTPSPTSTTQTPEPTSFKTKLDHAKHLLLKGTTSEELKSKLGWPSISVPATAKSLNLNLTKTKVNGVFQYKGEPMKPEEIKAAKAAAKSTTGTSKAASPTPAPAAAATPAATSTQAKTAEATEKAAKMLGVAEPTKHPPATEAELTKAKKNVELQLQYVPGAPDVPAAHALIKEFNDKYAGKTITDPHDLQQKVNAFKDMIAKMIPLQSAQQQAHAALTAKSNAEAAAKNKTLQEAAEAKKAAAKAAFEAKINDPKVKAQYDKLHSIGVSGTASLDHQFSNQINKLAKTGHQITGADAAYISAYTGSAYDDLNESLWKGDKMNLKQSIYASALAKSLDKMPSYQGTAVRGVKTPGAFARYEENVGHVVTERGFSSYGATHKLWGSEATIHLTATDLKDIRSFNSHEGGGELILQKGSMIHITKVNKKTREVWAEQIG